MRFRPFAALAAAFFASPTLAQFEAQPFTLGAPLPAVSAAVIEYRPPMRIAPVERSLREVAPGATVFVYVLPGNSAAESAALGLLKTANSWKKVKPVIVVRALSPAELQRATDWIITNGISSPVVVDRTMELALGLGATVVPSFAATDAQGRFQIRKVRGLDRVLENGVKMAEAIKVLDDGGALPLSDGERPDDIRSLVGSAAPSVVAEPAAGQMRAAVDLGKPSGKPRLVVFWLATCPHCQKEMPRIVEWWRTHKDQLELVAITRSDSPQIRQRTEDYLTSRKLSDMPLFHVPDSGWGLWKVGGVPAWAMVSTDGKVVHAQTGEDLQLMRNLDAALKKAR